MYIAVLGSWMGWKHDGVSSVPRLTNMSGYADIDDALEHAWWTQWMINGCARVPGCMLISTRLLMHVCLCDMWWDVLVFSWHKWLFDHIAIVNLSTSNVDFVYIYLPIIALDMTISCWEIMILFARYDFGDINIDDWSLQFQASNSCILNAAWTWTCFGNNAVND